MSNSEIRSRAWEIYKSNAVVILGMTAIITAFSLVGDLTENTFVRLLIPPSRSTSGIILFL